jgi:probable HAF family extracellular repeat protein
MLRHFRVAILTSLALLAGQTGGAVEFVPLGVGAWETSGSYLTEDPRGNYYTTEFVYPRGMTDDSRFFYYYMDPIRRLPNGQPSTATVPWKGLGAVHLADDGMTIAGSDGVDSIWYRFGENGAQVSPLLVRRAQEYTESRRTAYLSADGLTSIMFRAGGANSRDSGFGLNTKVYDAHGGGGGLSVWDVLHSEEVLVTTNALSGDGKMILGRSYSGYPLLWGRPGGTIPLTGMTELTEMSYDGSVVVGGAKWWTEATGAQYFGPEPTPEFTYAADSISADGTVIAGTMTTNGVREAFLWTEAGGFLGLGDLPGGVVDSYVTHVSSDGSTAIGMTSTDRGYEPFRWNAATGMQSVIDLLTSGGADLQGYDLTTTTAGAIRINDLSADGSVLVGLSNNGAWLARIALVPEPGAAALALLAIALPIHWRVRR